MRNFNKARLIDIADKGLDPYKKHVVGADGRLESSEEVKSLSELNTVLFSKKEMLNEVQEKVEIHGAQAEPEVASFNDTSEVQEETSIEEKITFASIKKTTSKKNSKQKK